MAALAPAGPDEDLNLQGRSEAAQPVSAMIGGTILDMEEGSRKTASHVSDDPWQGVSGSICRIVKLAQNLSLGPVSQSSLGSTFSARSGMRSNYSS